MSRLEKLAELFSHFPGIGPRQSKRFVFFLLSRGKGFRSELIDLIKNLGDNIATCSSCFRYFTRENPKTTLCPICMDTSRTGDTLMIVEKDVDLDNIERSGAYHGRYFVLGGTVPILEKEPENKVRAKELVAYVKKNPLTEIIIAFSANPDGDNTHDYVKKLLEDIVKEKNIKLSELGRGLSTGSELEYSDSETIKNAFKNRA